MTISDISVIGKDKGSPLTV